ncbi:MAG: hypothetical protein EOL97_08840 [Spirochaetia bacterium]|nr:hypothetical protein [Spirochaetia bacterium]
MTLTFKLLILIIIISLTLFSCDLFGVFPSNENNFADLPDYLTQNLYINYDSTLVRASVSDSGINVIAGTNPNHPDIEYYNRALEFDTSSLNDAGYTIKTTYVDESDSETPEGEIEATLTMICEKEESPTIKFIFGIYYNYDILIDKYIDNVAVVDWSTYLTWNEY